MTPTQTKAVRELIDSAKQHIEILRALGFEPQALLARVASAEAALPEENNGGVELSDDMAAKMIQSGWPIRRIP